MKVLSFPELRSEKGISFSKAHLYRLIGCGKFPKPVRLGENRVAFVETEIDAWLKSKIAERNSANSPAAA